MTHKQSQTRLKEIIDNFLLINLFIVIFFAIFFVFAVIMEINNVNIFLDFIQKIWNPLIVPLITILITSSLINGINSWWKRKWPAPEEDI